MTDHTFTPAQGAVESVSLTELARRHAATWGDHSPSSVSMLAAFGKSLLAAQPPAAPVETSDLVNRLRRFAVWNNRQSHYEPVPLCQEAATALERMNQVLGAPVHALPGEQGYEPPQSSADKADETAWLIEKDDPPVYCVLSDDYDEHWTPDVNKALRFARREDAQAYSDHIGWTSPPVRIAEHMWPHMEPMPRGGMKVDWWEQSVLYRRRLRALIKLVEKEGYSVSSDGRNGMPMVIVRTGDEPQRAPEQKDKT